MQTFYSARKQGNTLNDQPDQTKIDRAVTSGSSHWPNLGHLSIKKKRIMTPRTSRTVIRIRAEINKIEKRKIEKNNENKNWSFENIN